MPEFLQAGNEEEYCAAVSLFKAYAAGLQIDLSFQQFEKELQAVKTMYCLPFGGIILCKEGQTFIGCVAVRKMTTTVAEMKRMYVLPQWQGKGIGNELLIQAIDLAEKCGYHYARLDTLNSMHAAMNLYRKNGFRQIEAYYNNPIPTAVYFEKQLNLR
jgi:putative acetyltransferase